MILLLRFVKEAAAKRKIVQFKENKANFQAQIVQILDFVTIAYAIRIYNTIGLYHFTVMPNQVAPQSLINLLLLTIL